MILIITYKYKQLDGKKAAAFGFKFSGCCVQFSVALSGIAPECHTLAA